MKCHFCGKEVWLVRHLRDGDFCSKEHRTKYHERLRRSFEQLPAAAQAPARLSEFCLTVAVAELPPRPHGSIIFARHATSGPLRQAPTTLGVTPLFAQTFLSVREAAYAALVGVETPLDVQPLPNAALRLGTLANGYSAISGGSIPRVRTAIGLSALSAAAPAGAAISATPHLLDRAQSEPACPRMALTAILPEWLLGDMAVPAAGPQHVNGNGRHGAAPARRTSWLPVCVDAAEAYGAPRTAVPSVLAMAAGASPFAARLEPRACHPPVSGHPLFIDPGIERAQAVAERTRPSVTPLARPIAAAVLPAAPSPSRAELEHERNALNRPQPVAPWEIPMPAVERLACPVAALPPVFAVAPAGPALPVRTATARLVASIQDTAATVATQEIGMLPPARRQAALPVLPPGVPATLPESGEPRRVGPERLVLQTQTVAPAAQTGALISARVPVPEEGLVEAVAPSVEAWSTASLQVRLRTVQGMRPPVAAATPSPARSSGGIGPLPQTAEPAISATLPEHATYRRLPLAAMAGVAPALATCEARRTAPEPETVTRGALAVRQLDVPLSDISLLSRSEALPVEVYVQRARARVKRDGEWQATSNKALLPAPSLALAPARLEQLVLQDWKRRYPTPNAPVLKTAAASGAIVVAMPRRHNLRDYLRRDGRRMVTAIAASLVLCAGLAVTWSTGGVRKVVTSDRHWFKDAIARRAAFEVADNFHSGMSLWEGRKDWQRSWSHDSDGFVRTGRLALYKPTQQLTNYRLEFFGQIEKKSMDWVVRAADPQNYYAMKVAITEPGPRPLLSIIRYPVIGGKKGPKVQTPLTMMAHNNTPYRVAVDVHGSHFRAFIEGQEVDFWSDNRLAKGGVGFFSENDERARLYWMKVSNNTDWLGRLCGKLSAKVTGSTEALNLWDPEGSAGRTLAGIELGGILDAAKNADRKRAGPVVLVETQA